MPIWKISDYKFIQEKTKFQIRVVCLYSMANGALDQSVFTMRNDHITFSSLIVSGHKFV